MFISVVLKGAVSPISWVIFKTPKKFESRNKVYTFGILWLEIRYGPLEKLWGEWGIFDAEGIFFSLSNSLYEFF